MTTVRLATSVSAGTRTVTVCGVFQLLASKVTTALRTPPTQVGGSFGEPQSRHLSRTFTSPSGRLVSRIV